MTGLIDALETAGKNPLFLLGFILLVLLAMYRRSVKTDKGLDFAYQLFESKLTRQAFYDLMRSLLKYAFWVIVLWTLGVLAYSIVKELRSSSRVPAQDPMVRVITGTIRGVDESIPDKVALDLSAGPFDAYEFEDFSYDSNTGTFRLTVRQRNKNRWSSSVQGTLSSPSYLSASYSFPVEEPLQGNLLLKPKGEVKINRITRYTGYVYAVSWKTLLENSTKSDRWVTDVLVLGLGTDNSVCNPSPVPTYKYHASLVFGEEVTKGDGEDGSGRNTVHAEGTVTKQYCDGYLYMRVPTLVALPAESQVHYELILNHLKLQPVAFGFYDEMIDRRERFAMSELSEKNSKGGRP